MYRPLAGRGSDRGPGAGLDVIHRLFEEGLLDTRAAAALDFSDMRALVASAVATAGDTGSGDSKKRKNCESSPSSNSETSSKHAWIKCNDESLTVVEEEEVLQSAAYVLFYANTRSVAAVGTE